MDNEGRIERQPVALRFLTQDGYSEDPQRQIEYELLYIEKGRGRLFFTNSAVIAFWKSSIVISFLFWMNTEFTISSFKFINSGFIFKFSAYRI
jgi:hypothetical protein